MRAAICVAAHAGPRYDEEVAKARAFCARQGLLPVKVYPADFLRNDRLLANFFAAVREGQFEILVGPVPDSFPTRFLRQLLAVGVGLACYDVEIPARPEARED